MKLCSEASVEFKLDFYYGPNLNFIIYFIDENKNLFSQNYEIDMNKLYRYDMSISFDKKVYEPGENVSLNIKSMPNSVFALCVIDKSLEIMWNQNYLTNNLIEEQLNSFKLTPYYQVTSYDLGFNHRPIQGYWRYPDAKVKLENQGFIVLNDLESLRPIYESKC